MPFLLLPYSSKNLCLSIQHFAGQKQQQNKTPQKYERDHTKVYAKDRRKKENVPIFLW